MIDLVVVFFFTQELRKTSLALGSPVTINTLRPPLVLCHCSCRTRTWASLTPDSPGRRQWTAQMTPRWATVPSWPSLWGSPPSSPLFSGSLFIARWRPLAACSQPVVLQCCCSELFPLPQGFTYVAPSVLESLKEGFSFEPRTRPVRRHNSSPRTPSR